ncbi:MAG: DUF2164 domain-containing protein [Bacteroidota bacterium]
MPLSLPPDARTEAVASLKAYLRDEMDTEVGDLAAGGLLDFVLEEIGPSVYNQAVRDVQERLHAQVAEIDIEVHEEEFPYWTRRGGVRRGR